MSASSHIAVVGAGHAGGRLVQHLRALGHTGRLTLIGEEAHAPYERPALSKDLLLGASTKENLELTPAGFWSSDSLAAAGIERIRATADALNVDTRSLRLNDGRSVDFDLLVVATGGAAKRPSFMTKQIEGVHVLRTLDDCLALRASLAGCRKLAIIGAGVIGMEVASTAVSLGVLVTVLETGTGIMSRCLPPIVATWLAQQHVARGVDVKTGVSVADITHADQTKADALALRISAMRDGEPLYIDADCVLVAIGVDCNPVFLRGLGVSDERGVAVDAFCRSPAMPWLYAAGDVACTLDSQSSRYVRQETWRNAENQARAVAEIILGRAEPYRETQWMWTDQLGHAIQVTGIPEAGDAVIVRGALESGSATVIALRDGCVSSGVTINQSRDRRHLESLVRSRKRVDSERLGDESISLKEFV
ncbi:3-phenylpropionate/trans-cinnamate dioxygenase ferredoxin reductase subunit [Paraburkholderia sp. BL27I4N3]|uniref:NAD(P)/FAD-dependent oxidoreductase n=1 Tax=Paraburkholderia sp. BL27I4N3 TaxID=1938805 RepID=UPI000E22C241|nr:FAD-dependent oxidoreductase [Paraburkholderia sp. BL27I4N3]REE07354.1 3-phenylpropionate/trans-cinnamate dioxygenase ferredoxin reductase subunit [Paraburkholderia sp. BL27I4N3]